jgi:hypothetical protein
MPRSTRLSRRLPTSSVELWDLIAEEAAAESPLWAEALLPSHERQLVAVFSSLLSQPRYALGLETIYEGYLLHYGRSRLFAPADRNTSLLLGDYLYAHGLVRIAEHEDVDAVADLAALISLCAELRADGRPGDGAAWAATAALLAAGPLEETRHPAALEDAARAAAGSEAVSRALTLHGLRVD